MLGAAAAVFSIAQTTTSLFPSVAGGLNLSVLINPTLTNELEGLTRIYAYMGDVVVAGAIIAAGTAILARSSRLRLGASALFVLLTVGALSQFSRASYASMLAGFLVLVGIAIFRAPAPMAVARKVVPALVLLAALFPVLGLVHPTEQSSQSAAQVFATRAGSGIEEIQARSGTFGYRYNVQSEMLDVVGNRWPVGVGFWHPDDRFVSGLPSGSIRNGDVGVLNGITTIGAVGTTLLYLPVLGTILFLWRRRPTGSEGWDGFIFGASGWLFGVVVASISLVTLFSVQGLLLTAVVLVAAVYGRESRARARRGRSRHYVSLSVVIVTYRSDRCIEAALTSVRSQLPSCGDPCRRQRFGRRDTGNRPLLRRRPARRARGEHWLWPSVQRRSTPGHGHPGAVREPRCQDHVGRPGRDCPP